MMHSSFSILRNYRGSIPLIALGALAFSSIQTAQAKPESVTPIAQQQEQQRYLVQFHRDAATSQFSHSHGIKRGISLSNATINIESAGGKVVQTLPQVHAIAAYLTPKAVNKLQNDAQVIRIEKDPLRQLQAHPSKLKSKQLAPHSNAREIDTYGLTAIQADGVYTDTTLSQKVCVIDTGYDITHNDLMHGTNITGEVVASFDSKGATVNLNDWSSDSYGQGTHVSGTLAALGNNGLGIKGVASAGVMPIHHVKVIHKANYWAMWGSDLIAALDKCQQAGAKIVNVSLSGQMSSNIEAQAFASAWQAGVMVIAAAGNRGDSTPYYPASYPDVISVGATNADNNAWQFTQKNTDIELVAPGEQIYSTFPNNQYRSWDGSGIAVPYVTGVAALAWGQNPQCDADTIRTALQQSALDLGETGRDTTFGYGLVQLQNTLTKISNTQCEPEPVAPIFDHVVQVDSNTPIDIPFATSTIITPPAHGEIETASVGLRYVPTADFKGFDYFTVLSHQGEEKVVQVQVGQPGEVSFYLDSKESPPIKAIYDNGTLLAMHTQSLRRYSLSGELLHKTDILSPQIFNVDVLSNGDIITVGQAGSTTTVLRTFDSDTLTLKNRADIEHGSNRITTTSRTIIPIKNGGFTLFWAEPNFLKGQRFNANLEPITEALSVAGNPNGSDNIYLGTYDLIPAVQAPDGGYYLAYVDNTRTTRIRHLSDDLTTMTTLAEWQTSRRPALKSMVINSHGDIATLFSSSPTEVYLGIVSHSHGQLPLKNLALSAGVRNADMFMTTVNDKWLIQWDSANYHRFAHPFSMAVLVNHQGELLHEPITLNHDARSSYAAFKNSVQQGRVLQLSGHHKTTYTLNWLTPESWISPSILKPSVHNQRIFNQAVGVTKEGDDLVENVNHVSSGAGRDYIINGEQINAGAGHDRIELLSTQARTIDGGEDFDVVVVNGEQSDFQWSTNNDGSFQLIDQRSTHNTGNNRLINIEAIAFTSSQLLLQSDIEQPVTQQWTLPTNTEHALTDADSIFVAPTHGTLTWQNDHWIYQSGESIGTDHIIYSDTQGQLQHLAIHTGAPAASQYLPLEAGSKSRIVAGNNAEVFVAWNKIPERRRYFTRLDKAQASIYKGGVWLTTSYQNKDIRTDIAVSTNNHYGVVYNYGDRHYFHNYSDSNRSVYNVGISGASNARRYTGQVTSLNNGALLNLTQLTWNNSSSNANFQQRETRFDEHMYRNTSVLFSMPPLHSTLVSSIGLANSAHLTAALYDDGIQYQIFNEYGKPLGDRRTASTLTIDTTTEIETVATAAFPNGGFVIAWTQTGAIDGDGTSIALRYFAQDGTPTSEQINVNQTTTGDQQGVRLTTLADERVAVVWWSSTGDGDGKASFIRWFDKQGNPQSNEQLIIADTRGDQLDPDITTLSDDRVMVSLTHRGEIVRVFPTPATHGDDEFYSYQAALAPQHIENLVTDALYYGNAGDDTVFYPGVASDYTITTQANGEKTVIKPDGSSDRLFSIEHVRFY